MMISFGRHGTGSGLAAAEYMTQDNDHTGNERAGVSILKGDPFLVADIADDLDFKHKYSSGVIAWAAEENPTDEEIDNVLSEFEKLSFAGMSPDQYSWAAVQHVEDNGSKHVHFLIARVDLESGKAFNPAPPGHRDDYDSLRDKFNYEKGWARPDDPSRSRLSQDGHLTKLDESKNPKKQITDFLINRIEEGKINNRDDIKASLAEIGEITREGDNYISVKPDGFDRALRMKGAIYERQFSRKSVIEAESQSGSRSIRGGNLDPERAREANQRLQGSIEKRAKYNAERYPHTAEKQLDKTLSDRSNDLAGYLDRQLGRDAILNQPNNHKIRGNSGNEFDNSDTGKAIERDKFQPVRPEIVRSNRRDSAKVQAGFSDNKGALKDDGIRAKIERGIEKARRAIRQGYDSAIRTYKRVVNEINNVDRTLRSNAEAAGRISQQQRTAQRSNSHIEQMIKSRSKQKETKRLVKNRSKGRDFGL